MGQIPIENKSIDVGNGVVHTPAKARPDINANDSNMRVCAYCRVSTGSEEQQSSFEIQQQHYRQVADQHPNWKLEKIFADEGISGTSTKKRAQFNEMISQCKAGKYDLIVTKSVSRFARNLLDCLTIIRELKELTPPVGVVFETDSLYTLSADSELQLTILGTLAQEESIKKRESMEWSLKDRFKNKRFLLPEPYGFTRQRDVTGKFILGAPLEIVEDEAHVVRFIFKAFLSGYSLPTIADILNELQIPTRLGNPWTESTLKYMVENERYCGCVKTWKTFTVDVFKHKKRVNRNDRDQWFYPNTHDLIVSRDEFDAAQVMLANRRNGISALNLYNVVDSGLLAGFVPISYRWTSTDSDGYFTASDNAVATVTESPIRKDSLSSFDLTGYQVVSSESMMQTSEKPCMSVTMEKITFNSRCSRALSLAPYIQLLLHPYQKRMAIRPCEANDTYSIRWDRPMDGNAKARVLNAPGFAEALFGIMGWNPDFRYVTVGVHLKHPGKGEMIMFNIDNAFPEVELEAEEGKRSSYVHVTGDGDMDFGEEFYDFCLHNDFFYIHRGNGDMKAKDRPVDGKMLAVVPSEEALSESLEKVRMLTASNE